VASTKRIREQRYRHRFGGSESPWKGLGTLVNWRNEESFKGAALHVVPAAFWFFVIQS
jgi:hypothetical protein